MNSINRQRKIEVSLVKSAEIHYYSFWSQSGRNLPPLRSVAIISQPVLVLPRRRYVSRLRIKAVLFSAFLWIHIHRIQPTLNKT